VPPRLLLQQLSKILVTTHMNFDNRKSLHINLNIETHTALKICAFKYKLSMQEIFEELATQMIESEPYMLDLLNVLSKRKRMGIGPKISSTDTESIFKIIEEENPL